MDLGRVRSTFGAARPLGSAAPRPVGRGPAATATRAGGCVMGVDMPRAILAAAVRWLPAERAEWGLAMLAELDRIADPRQRWRFALGGVRVALVAAAAAVRFWPVRVLLSGACAGAVGAVIYTASAQLRVFAVVLAAELAVCGVLASIRINGIGGSDHRRPAAAGLAMRLGLLAGVAGCVGLGVYSIVRYPAAGDDPTHLFAVFFATVLVGYVWLLLFPPAAAMADAPARRFGLIGAAALAAVWGLGLAAAVLFGQDLLSGYVWAIALLAFLGIGILAGRATGRAEVGLATGVWAGLAGALSLFVIGMAGTLATVGDAPPARANWVVSDNLGGLIIMLLMLPVIGLSLTMLGSLLGASGHAPDPRTVRQP